MRHAPAWLMAILLLSGAAAAAMLSGCIGNESSQVDPEALKAHVRQADLALLQAEDQRDLEGAMEFIAPDAVFQPPGFPPIGGREAIRRFYNTQWFKLPFIEISGTPETVVLGSAGDLAYLVGKSRMVFEVSGEKTVAAGKYLGVWQNISGKWKLAAISWSANEMTR